MSTTASSSSISPLAFPQSLAGHLLDPQLTKKVSQVSSIFQDIEKLDFIIEEQTQPNWCWAAVASSVGNYYQTGPWSQCQVASIELESNCCDDPEKCNVYGFLNTALKVTRSLNRTSPFRLRESTIQKEIDEARVVCLRCAWNHGGAHFLVIYGVGNGYVLVADTIFGNSLNLLKTFPEVYQSGGKWAHSYYTKKNKETQ